MVHSRRERFSSLAVVLWMDESSYLGSYHSTNLALMMQDRRYFSRIPYTFIVTLTTCTCSTICT